MKRCSGCGSTENKFPTKGNRCQPCVGSVKRAARARRLAPVREYIQKKKSGPCSDCGNKYPYYVMDFDHIPDQTKSFNISRYKELHKTLDEVASEIEKCEVVCANCHRIRTFKRAMLY